MSLISSMSSESATHMSNIQVSRNSLDMLISQEYSVRLD